MVTTQRFEMRFGSFRLLLRLLGTGPRQTMIEVTEDALHVRMGWAFRTTVSRASIASAAPDRMRPLLGIGVHGWGGRWTVNGALAPMVAVTIDPPASARVLFVPVRLRRLRISVTDPDAMVAALAPSS